MWGFDDTNVGGQLRVGTGICPPIKEGDMVLFPSVITHEALPNMSDIRRTIVSYNLRGKVYQPKKTIEN